MNIESWNYRGWKGLFGGHSSFETKEAILNAWTREALLGSQYRTQKQISLISVSSSYALSFVFYGHEAVVTIVGDQPGMWSLEPEQ